jgi:IS30 family transposase
MAHLNLEQRYQICALKDSGYSQLVIAQKVGCSPSTISRELSRNKVQKQAYNPVEANNKAALRVKKKAWRFTAEMKNYIASQLKFYWSPEQIHGFARKEGRPMVSIETIYKWIYAQNRRSHNFTNYLRWQRSFRNKRSLSNNKRGQIPDRVLIDERDPEIEKRTRLGDFEIDLIIGKGHQMAILTIVDRTSRMLYGALLENKEAKTVTEKVKYLLAGQVVKTITSDNGKEFADHKQIAKDLAALYYFAHPYHSWERGSNENTNGLLRQFIPKNRPFADLTQSQLQHYINNINNRPRKIHGFKTSIEIFQELTKIST